MISNYMYIKGWILTERSVMVSDIVYSSVLWLFMRFVVLIGHVQSSLLNMGGIDQWQQPIVSRRRATLNRSHTELQIANALV